MEKCSLQMKDIVKSYSGVTVLKGVSLNVRQGEIHALLGENGAGKTTLMNILGGVVPSDSGEIHLFGKPAKINSPADSQALGIAFIHQELNVVNDLKVYENMFLGRELYKKSGILDAKRMCEETAKVFKKMNVSIDPREVMRDLQTSYKQIVEIAKALLMDAKLIIMDEPTTSLTQKEIDNVFSIIRGLTKDHGVTVIFISHKLGEVVDICDSYTVLRNGENVASGSITQPDGSKIKQDDLARMMVGKDVLNQQVYEDHEIGEVVLEVKDMTVGDRVKGVSFTLREGEILGITGLLGDGKDELVRALFGDLPHTGTIIKNGKPLCVGHPSQAKKCGIGYLPPNRKENAIIKDLSVQDNINITVLEKCRCGIALSRKRERAVAQEYCEKLRIKTSNIMNKITSLSGGNQQKAVLSKWLNAKPDIMIMSNPTQGVDVGAKNEIYAEIMKLARQKIGIIVTSGEAQEIIKLCDRVLVMYHGELRGELRRDQLTEENIMILSTGGSLN
ncbi:MAG: sugar ABC transporter ATP-binding protein [Clostridiaceae bacterium]|jgi:ribose transport system ATP-binding protein|nr:sugar ABC transporter ATP-binding protein [Bacillota bacterium]NLP08209.1 sugar ABC transporter ATP-binding protein [Clostridiaceae bacterium]